VTLRVWVPKVLICLPSLAWAGEAEERMRVYAQYSQLYATPRELGRDSESASSFDPIINSYKQIIAQCKKLESGLWKRACESVPFERNPVPVAFPGGEVARKLPTNMDCMNKIGSTTGICYGWNDLFRAVEERARFKSGPPQNYTSKEMQAALRALAMGNMVEFTGIADIQELFSTYTEDTAQVMKERWGVNFSPSQWIPLALANSRSTLEKVLKAVEAGEQPLIAVFDDQGLLQAHSLQVTSVRKQGRRTQLLARDSNSPDFPVVVSFDAEGNWIAREGDAKPGEVVYDLARVLKAPGYRKGKNAKDLGLPLRIAWDPSNSLQADFTRRALQAECCIKKFREENGLTVPASAQSEGRMKPAPSVGPAQTTPSAAGKRSN
jgi:hypothetical protein